MSKTVTVSDVRLHHNCAQPPSEMHLSMAEYENEYLGGELSLVRFSTRVLYTESVSIRLS